MPYEVRVSPEISRLRPDGSAVRRVRVAPGPKGLLEFGREPTVLHELPPAVATDRHLVVRTIDAEPGQGLTEPEGDQLRPESVQLSSELDAAKVRIAELEAAVAMASSLAVRAADDVATAGARVSKLEHAKADLLEQLEASVGELVVDSELVGVEYATAREAVEAALALVGVLPLRKALVASALGGEGTKEELVARYADHLLPPPAERPHEPTIDPE